MVVFSPFTPQLAQKDTDHDGVKDAVDNCPTVLNTDQSDVDSDGIGDACDNCTDSDRYGYGNPGFRANECPDDNCPYTQNLNQTDTDEDTIGDPYDDCLNDPLNDIDADGICGDVDNRINISNANQRDSDGVGDSCEVPPSANFTFTPINPTTHSSTQFWDNTTLGGWCSSILAVDVW
jgi:hypothetical protein